jgi:hypothetical protein
MDLLYLSVETVATALIEEAERRCNPFTAKPTQKPVWETPRWTLRAGRHKKEYGYDFIAEGRGDCDGITVLWGKSLAKDPRPQSRRFKLKLSSERCWRERAAGGHAYTIAANALEACIGDLYAALPGYDHVLVRRIDVCIDHWGYHWSRADLDQFACRQTVRASVERGEKPLVLKSGEVVEDNEKSERAMLDGSTFQGPESATYYIGDWSGHSVGLAIYNKTAEAKHSGKLRWMRDAWEAHGHDGRSTVWRAELRFGGEWSRIHGVATVAQLIGAEHALWRWYLTKVRHTTNRRSRTKRSATSRVWGALGAAARRGAREGHATTWSWSPRPPRPDSDMKRVAAMMAGCARKIDAAMFKGNKAALFDYIAEAMELSEQRASERQAKLMRLNPRPPPPPTNREAS